MQSTVALRSGGGGGGGGIVGSLDDIDEKGLAARMAFQRKLDDDDDNNNDDLLDDNDMERILSRPTIIRRKLDLFEAPEFVQRLSSYQEATVGDTVTFSGQYRAFPRPTVKWFKDEEEVTETQRHNIDLSSETEGYARLIIQGVIKQDEGAYKCKVENQEGVASTTGYLSVSGKPSDKGHSLQTKKIAVDRVSTPPYLRPIAEQKSMEEREEKEYQHLPPSPLQEFMNKIRHSAKAMQGPIVYADLADVYPDDDVIKDFNDDNADDEDVFDNDHNNSTPSGSPTPDTPTPNDSTTTHQDKRTLREELQKNNKHSIQLSAELQIPPVSTQTSSDDSAYDSDGLELSQGPGDTSEDAGKPGQVTNQRNRRLKLTLQRSHAVEITDTGTSSPGSDQCTDDIRLDSNRQKPPDTGNTADYFKPVENQRKSDTPETRAQEESTKPRGATISLSDLESMLDLIFGWIDSPWIQYFTGFVVGVTSLSLAADLPIPYLIAAVVILCVASFIVLERRLRVGQKVDMP